RRRDADLDAVLLGDLAAALLGRHDRDVFAWHVDVAHEERQCALTDRAAADHDDAAGIGNVLLVVHSLLLSAGARPRAATHIPKERTSTVRGFPSPGERMALLLCGKTSGARRPNRGRPQVV